MAIDIKVPPLGESIMEATVVKWHKSEGDTVTAGEILCELETDKVTMEVPAPDGGVLIRIVAPVDTDIAVGGLLGHLDTEAKPGTIRKSATVIDLDATAIPQAPLQKPPRTSPSVRKILEENDLNLAQISATGAGNRLTKGDLLTFIGQGGQQQPTGSRETPVTQPAQEQSSPPVAGPREQRVRMSRLRQRIAQRLKEAQNTAAMLTTFNEVDMTAIMTLRQSYRDSFEKKHGARLGFMSFFVKGAIVALQEFPAVNAEIQGDEMVYRNHYDIGIAVGGSNGLVVPVLRDANLRSMAEIEQQITEFGRRAQEGRLTLEELQGGTFTITNGGIFGSLLSTPILNTPQVGILGMHKVQQRPVVLPDGSIAARPMMYLALTYDHRVVDGREAVSFLVRIKECVEDPSRILLGA
ncbi:MAG: 2-oxoglutarate dehydrogenase complex dihydrolipoyllysine-residue succinyltransferase [Magnetococcales bacterium]|nr:2-oxoglutarate dehydrogenase complex dihydrolipoyllysine-residue succinyltransferase [Magnetococcales bacterium]